MAEHVNGYCRQCEAETALVRTVSWQDNSCTECGSTDVEVREE